MPHKLYQCCDSNNCSCGRGSKLYDVEYKDNKALENEKVVGALNKLILQKPINVDFMIKLRDNLIKLQDKDNAINNIYYIQAIEYLKQN